jgi:RNase adaptor protein for sRNA GlmZ degradation
MMEAARSSETLVNFYQTARRYNPVPIALMMEAGRSSETLVNFYQTARRYNPVLIALMMAAERSSETLVNFYQTTRRYNPEDSHLPSTRLHGTTSQKTAIFVLTVVRTSNPTQVFVWRD